MPATGAVPVSGALPPLPPTPVVQLMVLVPQDAAPNTDLQYTLRVVNQTTAVAHKVMVRMPVPDDVTFVKAEPAPDTILPGGNQPAKELRWTYKSLTANTNQSIQVTVRPNEKAREVNARAYVSFEHGQQVTTRLAPPKLRVRTDLPTEAVMDRWIPARVTITNEGRVPVQNVKLTANISKSFEFDRDTGGDPVANNPQQRVWELGTLPPGGTRQVIYRVKTSDATELLVQSAVDGSLQSQVRDEAKVAVKQGSIKVELTGDGTAKAGDSAGFEARVYNTGTLTLTNVRVTAEIPPGCKVTKMTNGGTETRDSMTWIIPRMTPGGSPYSVRWQLTATEAGRKSVRAAATATEGPDHSQMVETVFSGAPVLRWESAFDRGTLPVDRTGTLRIAVKNSGSDTARNVRVVVVLPREVSFLRSTPETPKERAEQVTFPARDLGPGEFAEYTLEFRAEQVGSAHFQATLSSDALGAEPLRSQKYVEITRR